MALRRSIGVLLPRDLPASQVLDYARTVELAGFDELWVVEDLGFRGGFSQSAAVLTATEHLSVGIGILPAAARNIAFCAMEVSTLAQLFPGRIQLGVGHGMPGWMRQAGCWPDRPLTYLSEYAHALRTLLVGRRVDGLVAGWQVDDLQLAPSCVPAVMPPLLLGVRGPRSLAASGRIADGTVLAEPCAPEYVRAALRDIAPRGEHRVVAYNVAAVDEDPEAAVRTARTGLEWIGEPDWAPHLAPLPFAAELAAARAAATSREQFAAALPSEWVQQLALAGTRDQVRARMDELFVAGVTSTVFIPIGADPMVAVRALATVL